MTDTVEKDATDEWRIVYPDGVSVGGYDFDPTEDAAEFGATAERVTPPGSGNAR